MRAMNAHYTAKFPAPGPRFFLKYDYRLKASFPNYPDLPFVMIEVASTLYVGPGFEGETQWWKRRNNPGTSWRMMGGDEKNEAQWLWITKVEKEIEDEGISDRDFLNYVGVSPNTLRGYKKRALPFYRFCLFAKCAKHLRHVM